MPTIEIVSDVVCPWCFIGLRRLSAAIELVRQDIPDFSCRKRWLPFFLNPDTPPEGEPYLPFLIAKFGGRERVEAIFERIREAGRAHGVEYAFEKIQVRANTLDAHRLVYWAQQQGTQKACSRVCSLPSFSAARTWATAPCWSVLPPKPATMPPQRPPGWLRTRAARPCWPRSGRCGPWA